MSKFLDLVAQICLEDDRYKPDAYEFILSGLSFTQEQLKKPTHITGKELSWGLKDYAINQYGALAQRVLAHWGITQTQDFGNIVFKMIDKKLLAKTEEDSLADFDGVFDFNVVFANILVQTVEFKDPQ